MPIFGCATLTFSAVGPRLSSGRRSVDVAIERTSPRPTYSTLVQLQARVGAQKDMSSVLGLRPFSSDRPLVDDPLVLGVGLSPCLNSMTPDAEKRQQTAGSSEGARCFICDRVYHTDCADLRPSSLDTREALGIQGPCETIHSVLPPRPFTS